MSSPKPTTAHAKSSTTSVAPTATREINSYGTATTHTGFGNTSTGTTTTGIPAHLTRPQHEMVHYNEPTIIEVTSYDDLTRAIEDGRLDKITDEHIRYMKETG